MNEIALVAIALVLVTVIVADRMHNRYYFCRSFVWDWRYRLLNIMCLLSVVSAGATLGQVLMWWFKWPCPGNGVASASVAVATGIWTAFTMIVIAHKGTVLLIPPRK